VGDAKLFHTSVREDIRCMALTVDGGYRSGGGQRWMEGLRRQMCKRAQDGLSTK